MYKKISDWLSADSALTPLRERLNRLAILQEILHKQLEPPLNQHVIVANCDGKQLLIHTDSPTWAAKLRFRIPDILKIVKKNTKISNIDTIRIKVALPETAATGRKPRLPIPISAENAQHLLNLARATEDRALAAAIARLAAHGLKPGGGGRE